MALDKLKYTYQDPAKVSQLNVDDILNVNTANATTLNSTASVISPTSSNIGLSLRSPLIPLSDLQQFRNSSNAILSGISPAGQIFTGASSPRVGADTLYSWSSASSISSTTATFTHNSSLQLAIPGQSITMIGWSPSYFNGTFIVTSVSGTGPYTYTVHNPSANFTFPGTYTIPGYCRPTASFTSVATTPFTVPMIVQGAVSQSTSLQEWQTSTGSRVAHMNSAGSLTILALHPNRIQDATLTGAQLVPVGNTSNLLNSSGMVIRALGANQQALVARSSFTAFTITAATANGTTITYTTSSDIQFMYVGMRATITGVVSTGNASATAGSGFNLVNATIASITGQQFTVTNSLVDTYTSGGVATATTTADIQQWQNGASSVVASVSSTGGANFTGSVNVGSGGFVGSTIQESNQSASTITLTTLAGNTINSGAVRIRPRGATGMPLIVQGANTSGTITAATANGTTITYTSNVSVFIVAGQSVTITGIASTGNPGATSGSGFNLTNATVASASGTQFTVTNSLTDTYTSGGALTVTHSADLTQWQDPSGNIKAYINSAGAFVSNQLIGTAGYMYSVAPASFGSNGLTNSYQVQVVNGAAARIGLMVKGAPSQSANLQEWQNSDGSVASSITKDGNFATGGIISSNSLTVSSSASIGGSVDSVILSVREASGQTANLTEWLDYGSTILSAIDAEGNFTKGDGSQLVLAGQIF